MSEIPLIVGVIKECPWCHRMPKLFKTPLWKGSHGYPGNYEYYLSCKNPNCKIQPRTKSYNDIYSMMEEDCINHAIKDWNNQ